MIEGDAMDGTGRCRHCGTRIETTLNVCPNPLCPSKTIHQTAPVSFPTIPVAYPVVDTRRTCAKCSGSGIYIDYAGPDVIGGIAVPCKHCGGKGWV